jgi:hypothetical protein
MFSLLVAALCLLASPAAAQGGGVRGDAAAVAAAQRLLSQAGGAAVWRQRRFEVLERGYLRSGEVAELHIVRDFQSGSRLLERTTPSHTLVEWVSPQGGWTRRNGVLAAMNAPELAAELQGLRQEPYAIYHRLARNDPDLRAELRDEGLYVFDRDERMLCWFPLAPNGVLLGWGNFYDGSINQHYYGPVADMGDANLPRWGLAMNGSFRFEYLRANLTDAALEAPLVRAD